jgi:ABC-type multidrug transport system fused ATPase/permease subunit
MRSITQTHSKQITYQRTKNLLQIPPLNSTNLLKIQVFRSKQHMILVTKRKQLYTMIAYSKFRCCMEDTYQPAVKLFLNASLEIFTLIPVCLLLFLLIITGTIDFLNASSTCRNWFRASQNHDIWYAHIAADSTTVSTGRDAYIKQKMEKANKQVSHSLKQEVEAFDLREKMGDICTCGLDIISYVFHPIPTFVTCIISIIALIIGLCFLVSRIT